MSYKPDGYTDVAPYLIVRDAEAVLDFLEAAFGADRLRLIRRDDGSPMHAEARIGDSVVMLGQVGDGTDGGAPAHVHVYVPDVRATHAAATEAGGVSVQKPADKGDGDLRAGVKDPSGTTWWFATQRSDSEEADELDNVPV